MSRAREGRDTSAARTEVEQYVRDRVAETGEPCLFAPDAAKYPLLAVPVSKLFEADNAVYVLGIGTEPPLDPEEWAVSTRIALGTVRQWVPERPEGVAYVNERGAADAIRRVEATALGLSLLQLALNRAGSRLVIGLWP
jgi:hypothetical protein